MIVCNIARRARQVGICLKHLPSNRTNRGSGDDAREEDENDEQGEIYHHFHDDNVPWQRVVNSRGTISHRFVPLPPFLID
jgi:methylated-DNA-protein-cysteine methyltransferase-like protein